MVPFRSTVAAAGYAAKYAEGPVSLLVMDLNSWIEAYACQKLVHDVVTDAVRVEVTYNLED